MATCSALAGLETTARVARVTPAQGCPLALTCPRGGTRMGFALENNCPSVAESLTSLRLDGVSPAVPGEPR